MIRRRVLVIAALASCGPALAAPPAVPRAALVDQDGQPVRLDELIRDRPVVLSFFYTGCSTICPTQTATLRDLQETLHGETAPAPLLVSVSLDPLGDTPETVQSYARRFELQLGTAAGWVMLTGSDEQLGKVWRAFDAAPSGPSDHAPLLWIGRPGAWTRYSAFASAATLADAVRATKP